MDDRNLKAIQEEYDAPIDQRRALIRSEGGTITDYQVEIITNAARRYLLPVSAMALIPTRTGVNPYVTADGFLWRVHNDSRGRASIDVDILQWADENHPVARAKARVTFQDGTYATDVAQLSLDEEKKRNPKASFDTINKKVSTSAVRRACAKSVGIPFPVFEEYIEFERTPVSPPREHIQKPEDKIRNIAEFLAEAWNNYGVKEGEILGILGISNLSEISDFDEALERLGK